MLIKSYKKCSFDNALNTKQSPRQFLRGAKSEEKKRLNELGGKILRDAWLNFDVSKDYDFIKSNHLPKGSRWDDPCYHVGYAGYYLEQMSNKTGDVADASLYRKLVDIDTGLGTKASDQLYVCLTLTSKPEFIKVRI